MTAIIFAVLPQRLKPDVCPVLPVKGVDDMQVLFCDAPPSKDCRRFFMGGGYRHWGCPKWIRTLQQAELLAIVRSFQLVACMGCNRAYLGSDSSLVRAQAFSFRASIELHVQQRILRRFSLVPLLVTTKYDCFLG